MRTFEEEEIFDWRRPVQEDAGDSGTLTIEADNYTDRFRKAFISKAKNDITRYVIEQYFEALESGVEPESVASLFSENVDFYIPGHIELVPWIEHKKGRAGVVDFINKLREKMESIDFKAESKLVDGAEAAVALGELEAREKQP